MPGVLLEMDPLGVPIQKAPEYGFVVSHQQVELDVDFATQSLKGRTILTVLPLSKDLREIKIDARQCEIGDTEVLVNERVADFEYEDPMTAMDIPDYLTWGVQQHKQMRERLAPLIKDSRANGLLAITIPKGVRIEEVDPYSANAASEVTQRAAAASAARSSSMALDGTNAGPLSAASIAMPKTVAEQAGNFQPLLVSISFTTKRFRDGLHFVGLGEGDTRFPHVYTKHSMDPGIASCIFPCIDDPAMRCTWEISVKCSRTLGDALKKQPVPRAHMQNLPHLLHKKGLTNDQSPLLMECQEIPLSDEEKLLEMTIVCSGDLVTETIDLDDGSKKIATFTVNSSMAPQHIGFAIGPFEQVDLSEFREAEDDEKLGQAQALPVLGYCLPGRADEVRHTCAPLAHALDFFLLHYSTYPSSECRFVFVDDQVRDVEHTTSLTICSTRLLFGEDIIDPEIDVVRTLVHGIATQWLGVMVVPEKPSDRWVTVGLSHWMTEDFMKSLCGHNEYAFRQKMLTDKLVKLDVDRPSLHALGEILHLGAFEHDFMKLKAPLVMFILDRRCLKASGSMTGLHRVLARVVTQASIGSLGDSVISTEGFRRSVEKITKYRQTEPFWNQWVLGAGCPKLNITQKFNKKRLCVEVTITQKHEAANPLNPPPPRPLERDSFMREFKEDIHGIYAGEMQPFFTGPLTIRIHEADGTPYEHIVEIKDGNTKIEIPYNTKYKRLKRKNLQKQRQAAGAVGLSGDGSDEALYYCLGDVLQSREDMDRWGLSEWTPEQEQSMDQESYEWLRVDADFEWLCEKHFIGMPAHMFLSQLQQDRDVVAQQESIMYFKHHIPNSLSSTFLLRTIMDHRYFYGIRQMAAEALDQHTMAHTNWSGLRHLERAYQALFCYDNSKMPRSNDFSDKRTYKLEMAMVRAFARQRDVSGKCLKDARVWLLDILRFNDNTSNEFSDYFKIANLLVSLTDSIIVKVDKTNLLNGDEEPDWEFEEFKKSVIDELDRYRRMDEWINSYQNIYTVTVLACKQRLMKAKVIPCDAVEFAQYLHDGTSDFVRIKAFEALVDLGFMNIPSVASLLLNVLSTDPSPYMREHLFEVFCLGLAIFAFGDAKPAEPVSAAMGSSAAPAKVDANGDVEMIIDGDAPPNGVVNGALEANVDGGLIVENDISLVGRKAELERTTSIEGALAALKMELKDNEELKEALWKAIKSPVIELHEQTDLLDICSVLYEATYSMCIKLQKPKFWKVDHLGKGVLLFNATDKFREKPIRKHAKPLPPPPAVVEETPVPAPVQQEKPPLKLVVESPSPSLVVLPPPTAAATPTTIKINTPTNPKITLTTGMRPPKRPLPPERTSSTSSVVSSVERPRKMIKLNVPASKMQEIISVPPNPITPRTKGSSSASPGPRPSPSSRPSPAPKSSNSPAPSSTISVLPRTSTPSAPSSATPTIKFRKPLPDSGSAKSDKPRQPLPDSVKSDKPRQPLPGSAPKSDKPKYDKPKSDKPKPDKPKSDKQRQPLPGAAPKSDKPRHSLPATPRPQPQIKQEPPPEQGQIERVPATPKEKPKFIIKLNMKKGGGSGAGPGTAT